ncbi:MAG: hemolysin III family protein [Xanthomonadales bacterium]|nr:hemolysin III family protein [Gammaproteobacteria bacterium]MBT8053914.1 hemolysin III family protein [Gammaproteobacteria bacterium]NND58255.1 hemolysin III family protein [Xanthomonadales bacterium]NNK52034.1 hemolysin III family protein [Xanthomonadales bacterium]
MSAYSPVEERINILSHAAGLLLSLAATALMMIRAATYGNAWHIVSAGVFGLSLIALYTASTLYHSAKSPRLRARLRIIDHATIYVLIAGTYTPFTLITLNGAVGWVIFAVTWGMAVTGIVLKLFFTGRFNLVSTLMYVFMGWIILFAVKPLAANLSAEGIYWVVAGGLSYTTGATIYSFNKIPLNHAIFHLFVLLGSFCHVVAVYFHVLPGP